MAPISVNADLFTTNRLPTDEEYTQLTQHVEVHKTRLSELDKKISQLTMERAALVAEIAPVKQALAPIRRVPEDILREIFVACLNPHRNPVMSNKEAPVVLTQISSHMRRIALTTPVLWAAIHIAIIGPVPANGLAKAKEMMQTRGQAVREWLQRSGSVPLSISVFEQGVFKGPGGDRDCISPIMAAICKFSLRWKSVHICCFPETLIDVCALGLEDFPLIQSATFSLMRGTGMNDARTIMPGIKLTNLGLDFIANVSGFKNIVAWSKLTHIHFPYTPYWDRNDSLNDVVDILRQTTCLVSCNVFIDHDLDVLDAIHLPYLKDLTINNGRRNPDAVGLLAAIRAPVLDVMYYNMERRRVLDPCALIELLKHSPSATELAMGPCAKPSHIVDCLRQCPQLRTLHIQNPEETDPGSDVQVPEIAILDALAPDEGSLSLCPMLENFRWGGVEDVSPQSLQKFLEKKRQSTGTNVAKWKTVIIEFRARPDDLDIFIEIQNGGLGHDTNLHIGGHLLDESHYSVRDGIFQPDPTDSVWPSKIRRSYGRYNNS